MTRLVGALRLAYCAVVRRDDASRLRLRIGLLRMSLRCLGFPKLGAAWDADLLRLAGRAETDEFSQFILSEKLTQIVYPKYRFSEFGRQFLEDREFREIYEAFAGTTNYHSLDRKYALRELMKLVLHLDGDTAECGVFNGTSSFLMCQMTSGSGKTHHAFDSFEGLSAPGGADGSYWKKGDLCISEAEVAARFTAMPQIVFHKGWIPERFADVAQRKFCFVHVDVDLFQPTRDSLEFFYPRMVRGGIILCDDYGFTSCPGAQTAFDTYLADKPEKVVNLPTGQGFIVRLGE